MCLAHNPEVQSFRACSLLINSTVAVVNVTRNCAIAQPKDPWLGLDEGAGDEDGGQDTRRIRLGPGAVNEGYVGNSIRTAKYNIITFVPLFLWTMIKRVAYVYFFFQASVAGHCASLRPWNVCKCGP